MMETERSYVNIAWGTVKLAFTHAMDAVARKDSSMTSRGETFYGYEHWDKEQFTRAGHCLAKLAERRDGEGKMRDMILRLYMQNEGIDTGESV